MKANRALKIWSILLAMVMCFTVTTTSAYAAETTPSVESDTLNVKSIDEAGISRDEALQWLGLTEDEAQGVQLYALDATNQVTINSGETHRFPTFTFTGENGGSYFTVNGDRMKVTMRWFPRFSDSTPGHFRALIWPYGSITPINQVFITTEWEPNAGSNVWSNSTDWFDVTKGLDYRITYYCNRPDIGTELKCDCTVIVAVE